MSSRFVSGGAIDAATGAAVELKPKPKTAAAGSAAAAQSPPATGAAAKPSLVSKSALLRAAQDAPTAASSQDAPVVAEPASAAAANTTARHAEWAAVEKQLEAERQRRAEARKAAQTAGAGSGEKSLYEALQANKAAKQAAFEEQHKLKNQFRALDEDEIEFLDGLEAEARAAEARAKAEMAAGLDAFRAAQGGGGGGGAGAEGEKGTAEDDVHGVEKDLIGDTAWAIGRKRKRRTDNKTAFPHLKRKSNTAENGDKEGEKQKLDGGEKAETKAELPTPTTAKTAALPPPPPKPKATLGLADYGSDDDDSD